MSGTIHISARFIGNGIVLLIGIRSHRVVCHIDTVGIDIKLCARCTVLHIVFPVVFRQPGTFDISAQHSVRMVLAEALPAMLGHIQVKELFRLALLREAVVLIQLHTTDGIDVG